MKNSSAQKIKMTSLDQLLGVTQSPEESIDKGQVIRVPLTKLHTFSEHPFLVLDDEKMAETVESVKEYGVLMPGLVRPHKVLPGEYELISGHRRRRASELAGIADMPVIVKELSDDEATVLMVDSNIQREELLPSEKARAYKMKYEALKRLGMDNDVRNDQILARESGESRNTIQRYIRLTYLIPELLQMVDDKKLPRNTAAEELSFLRLSEQRMLLNVMQELDCIPSGAQAQKLKELSRENHLSISVIKLVMDRAEIAKTKVSLPTKKIREYFPESYTGKQIETVIYELLEEWKNREENRL